MSAEVAQLIEALRDAREALRAARKKAEKCNAITMAEMIGDMAGQFHGFIESVELCDEEPSAAPIPEEES